MCSYADSRIYKNEIIQPVLSQKVHSISSGERRYLELCIIFGLERDFYLLDEPFTGVSPILIEAMMRAIKEKKERGRGVLLTDHYTRYVNMVADDLYELRDGYCRRK